MVYSPLSAKSCSHLKELNPGAESGTYIIDPDGHGALLPFNVNCNMTDKNGVGVTVISHDSENRILVDGCVDGHIVGFIWFYGLKFLS